MNRHLHARITALSLLILLGSVFFTTSLNSQENQWKVVKAYPKMSLFEEPVDVQAMPGTDNLCVVEKPGRLRIFRDHPSTEKSFLFLDITDRVHIRFNEMGLLGLAFHPEFSKNGFFYINYTAKKPQRTIIARYQVDPHNSLRALKHSEKVILEIRQPHVNHNGGGLAFGPDGYLYIGMGDGGRAGDPNDHAQNLRTFLGAMLRIDVNTEDPPYTIPPDNPFAKSQGDQRKEIFAWGLRNPWRFSFDKKTGKLWAGDVGQNRYEEIDIIESGGNYGWNFKEGFENYKKKATTPARLINPVHTYKREHGMSIVGGHVYRESKFPELQGTYIYADFYSGNIWGLTTNQQQKYINHLLTKTRLKISSFGFNHQRNLLIVDFLGGLYQLEKVTKN